MAERTKIEYCDGTLNFFYGCSRKSSGCDNCWALQVAVRHAHNPTLPEAPREAAQKAITKTEYGWDWSGEIGVIPGRLEQIHDQLTRSRVGKVWLVQGLGDLFNQAVPDELREGVVRLAAECPAHTFLLLTKLADEQQSFFAHWCDYRLRDIGLPLKNLWPGVTAEDNELARIRFHDLYRTPAAFRWASIEPMLGSVMVPPSLMMQAQYRGGPAFTFRRTGIDWIVAGGETGRRGRPLVPEWVQHLRDQCQHLEIPFFFKRWGLWKPLCPLYDQDEDVLGMATGYTAHVVPEGWIEDQFQPPPGSWIMERRPKGDAGRLLDGRTWDERPGWV